MSRHQPSNFFNNLYSETVIFPKYRVRFTTDDRFVTGNPFTTYAYPVDPVGGKAFPYGQYTTAWGSTGKLKYDFTDAVQLNVIAGYRTYETDWMADGDQMPIDLNHTYNLQGHWQKSIEARLSGVAFDKKVDWTVGRLSLRRQVAARWLRHAAGLRRHPAELQRERSLRRRAVRPSCMACITSRTPSRSPVACATPTKEGLPLRPQSLPAGEHAAELRFQPHRLEGRARTTASIRR